MDSNSIQTPTDNIFINDVVQSQLDSDAVDSMVQVAVTNVLVIYTGYIINRRNDWNAAYKGARIYSSREISIQHS